jgi:ssDNA-binding Zn-finger/Zn-ribbon topoisomerase 1
MEIALCILFVISILICVFVLIVDLNISRPCSKCHKHTMVKEDIDGRYFYICDGCGHIQRMNIIRFNKWFKNLYRKIELWKN